MSGPTPANDTSPATAGGTALPPLNDGLFTTVQNAIDAGAGKVASAAGTGAKDLIVAGAKKVGKSLLDSNVVLVGVGIVLALGALLISQKKTIVKVADTAAKAGALMGG